MRRIGVLTFHNVMNYGAVLQCYALQKSINDKYGDCLVIPYVNRQLALNDKSINLCRLNAKSVAKTLSQGYGNVKKRNAFNAFIHKYLPIGASSKLNDYTDIVVGSDQVWNVNLTNYDFTYLLEGYLGNKFAYAASFGEERIPDAVRKRIKEDVSKFDAVSVRECVAQQYLSNEGIESKVVVDPVLLLDEGAWEKIAENAREKKDKYILVYCVEKSKKIFEYTRRLSKRTGLKVYYLNQNLFFKEKGFIYKRGVSPIDFLGYIRDAEYIVTNSFHGTAFSIIFEKKFAVDTIWHEKKNVRVSNLLNLFDLNSRSIDSEEECIDRDIDYIVVKAELKKNRTDAQKFLDYCFLEKIEQ